MDAGYYWATIKHTGEVEVIEVTTGRWRDGQPVVYRMGDSCGMYLKEFDVIELIERHVPNPTPNRCSTGQTFSIHISPANWLGG